MSEAAIEPFKIEDAATKLREKIRLAFVELIPPEQWEAMVKKELEAFTKDRIVSEWNGQKRAPSLFVEIATEVYKEHIKTLFKAELAKPEWNQPTWQNGRQAISDNVNAWLTENSQALLQATLKELFGYQAQSIIQSIMQR